MEKKYWIDRKRSAMAMAGKAITSEARLIHYDLAGRYSIQAAQCVPFVQTGAPLASLGEGAALHLPDPNLGYGVNRSHDVAEGGDSSPIPKRFS